MAITRRDLLWAGAAAATGAGAWVLGSRRLGGATEPIGPARGAVARTYGHGVMPPAELGPQSLDAVTTPLALEPASRPVTRRFSLETVDQRVGVSADHAFDAWTFGGTVPGPLLRAREGDPIEITLENRSDHPHNLHFHGRHDVAADGWEPVRPGGKATYRFTAGPFGLHPYHCDLTPSEDHIANGLYGLLIVDPPNPRPPAHEIALVLGGFDLDGDGKSDLFGWNGVAGYFAKYPLKVPVGALVRVYLANLVSDSTLASFHLHAEMFDVYRNGTRLVPDERTDILSLGPAERALVEFRLPNRGRYMFHPHQRQLAEHGAMGWFAAV